MLAEWVSDRYFKLYVWIVGATIIFGIYVVVLIQFLESNQLADLLSSLSLSVYPL